MVTGKVVKVGEKRAEKMAWGEDQGFKSESILRSRSGREQGEKCLTCKLP